jgi:uncharacterized protein YfaP (DUF2135 family)
VATATSTPSTGTGSLSGTVVNAVNAQPIVGASVTIAGTGLSTTTNASGQYSFSAVPAGSRSVSASASGFSSSTQSVTVPASGSATLNFALSPTLPAGQFRIVLTWGATPPDLDSNLWVPQGATFTQVFFGNLGSLTAQPFALLDVDDITGFGPETITVSQVQAGTYRYAVRQFSGGAPPAPGSVTVQVFGSTGLLQTFTNPAFPAGQNCWIVFNFNAGGITPVNTFSSSSSTTCGQPGAAAPAPAAGATEVK